MINLLEVKQIDIGVNKMDCDNANIKQYKYDEVKNCKASTHNNTLRNFGANPGWYEWYRWYEWNERNA